MDHQQQMTLMDPYDQSIPIEKILGQEKKWIYALNLVSVNVQDRAPVSASNVAWLIYNGHVPKIGNHTYQQGRLELSKTWSMGDFYQATKHWESLGLSGYNAQYDYCSLRGDDLEHDLSSWEATAQLLKLIKKPKTTQRILD